MFVLEVKSQYIDYSVFLHGQKKFFFYRRIWLWKHGKNNWRLENTSTNEYALRDSIYKRVKPTFL